MRVIRAAVTGGTLSTLWIASVSLAGDIGQLKQPIIYGEDDRLEVYEVESDILRQRAVQSVAAFVSPRSLSYEEGGVVSIHAPTLSEVYGLCTGEPFEEEPALAWCSGVLVDDDLVATAGHCLGSSLQEVQASCRDLAIVFGYMYGAAGELAPLTVDSVYRCRRVVAWNHTDFDADPDFGVVQLDRPVGAGLSPAPFAANPVNAGEHVTVIGFGSGLPAKVDGGAVATLNSPFSEFFTGTTDTFAGASGSGLFNDAGEVLGIHVRGQPDWEPVGACTIAARTNEGEEVHQRAQSALDAICDAGWPSTRLCGIQATCGDGVCSAGEGCLSDCPPPSCGNSSCEGTEPSDCEVDCPSYVDVPPEWTCTPAYYGDRLGCDCNCGARDIDCDSPIEEVLNCVSGAFCNSEGHCERPLDTLGADADGDGRPDDPGDEFITDELDNGPPMIEKMARSDDGCALVPRVAHAGSARFAWLLVLLSLCYRFASRRMTSIRVTALTPAPKGAGSSARADARRSSLPSARGDECSGTRRGAV